VIEETSNESATWGLSHWTFEKMPKVSCILMDGVSRWYWVTRVYTVWKSAASLFDLTNRLICYTVPMVRQEVIGNRWDVHWERVVIAISLDVWGKADIIVHFYDGKYLPLGGMRARRKSRSAVYRISTQRRKNTTFTLSLDISANAKTIVHFYGSFPPLSTTREPIFPPLYNFIFLVASRITSTSSSSLLRLFLPLGSPSVELTAISCNWRPTFSTSSSIPSITSSSWL